MSLAPGTRIESDGTIVPPTPSTPSSGKTYDDGMGNTFATHDAAAASVATGSPVSRTIDDPNYDAANKYLSTFTQPQSESQIAESKRTAAQGLIDSINNEYDSQVADAQKTGQERLNQTDAISVLTGLTGSTEANRTHNVTSDANQKVIDAINKERASKIATIYSGIQSAAQTEARQQVLDAQKSAEDIVARRKASQEQALTTLKALAATGGIDFEAFKNSPQNADVYKYALNAVGGSEDALKAVFTANRPQDTLVGSPLRVGDHFIQAYKNPLTNKISYDTIQVPGLGTEYSSFQKIGSQLVAIPSGWDGDTSKLKYIGGGAGSDTTFTTTQTNKGAASAGLDVPSFKQLDSTVQNFYINGGTPIKAMNDAIAGVKDGSQTADEVKAQIDQSNQPQPVKDYLKQQVDAATPSGDQGGLMHTIANYLGGFF